MSTTLKIINHFTLDSQGLQKIGKQGNIADLMSDEFSITDVTIAGTCHYRTSLLATATVNTAYDSSNDFPATFDYLFFWADVTMCLQIIGTATEARFKVLAKTPMVLAGYGSIVASAGTSVITGGTEPTYTAVSKVAVGNYSGGSGNYVLALID